MKCKICDAYWVTPNLKTVLTHCPFCQAVLPVEKNYDPNSIEEKMLSLVTQFSPEIYNQPSKLNALILDLLNGEEIIDLLKIIIEKNASIECYKLKGLSGNEFNINYNKAIDIISSKTYIAKDIVTPAFNLLCIGLGLDVPTTVVTPAPPKQVQVQSTPLKDFTINNNILKKYIGAGGVVVIPNTIIAIESGAFYACKNLTSIIIPNSVTKINKGTFWDCINLTSVVMADSVISIGQYAFWGCTNLLSIVIPDSVKKIEGGAFGACKNLSSIVIPDSVTTIEKSAFGDCPKIPKDTIAKIKSINPQAFL